MGRKVWVFKLMRDRRVREYDKEWEPWLREIWLGFRGSPDAAGLGRCLGVLIVIRNVRPKLLWLLYGELFACWPIIIAASASLTMDVLVAGTGVLLWEQALMPKCERPRVNGMDI